MPNIPIVTDEQLIAKHRRGDREAFPELVRRYLAPLYRFLYHYTNHAQDAEDVVQETFFRAWRNLRQFNEGKSFKTWIFSIAKNTALDMLKKKKPVPFAAFTNAEGDNVLAGTLLDPAPLPSELFDRADIAETLGRAMERLSQPFRTVLLLYYREQLTFREIAEILEEPLHTVKSRHRRAVIALRGLLGA